MVAYFLRLALKPIIRIAVEVHQEADGVSEEHVNKPWVSFQWVS